MTIADSERKPDLKQFFLQPHRDASHFANGSHMIVLIVIIFPLLINTEQYYMLVKVKISYTNESSNTLLVWIKNDSII